MLRSLKEITGYTLQETDDVIGTCKDFLFDDALWVIRYMVADTGTWFKHHEVLITPTSMEQPDWRTERIPVNLSRKQIEESPPLDAHAPLSREYEITYHEHFEIPFYWLGADFREGIPNKDGAVEPVEDLPIDDLEDQADEQQPSDIEEGSLRRAIEIMTYGVIASDGDVGRVEDLIVDDTNWVIQHLIIDTGNIIPGKKIMLDTSCIESVSWEEATLQLDLTKTEIEQSRVYDATEPVNREHEVRLYDYHGRPRYWEKDQI